MAIDSPEKLEKWLDGKPREVAIMIAMRAALRAAPFVASELHRGGKKRRAPFVRLTTAIFRCNALARAAARYPARAHEIVSASSSASRSAAFAASSASRFAADAGYAASRFAAHAASTTAAIVATATATAPATAAVSAVSAASRSASSAAYVASRTASRSAAAAASAAWREVAVDVEAFDSAIGQLAVQDAPLWRAAWPTSVGQNMRRMQDGLPLGQNWVVWIDWYEARLAGRATSEAYDMAFVPPEEEWAKGPAAANAWIAARLAEINSSEEQGNSPPRPEKANWDFFISYSTKNESIARQIVDILEGAGHTVLAQFKDFAVGGNFVHQMQQGLSDSGRVIALYSPDYWASPQCKAEWYAAYNSDPLGEKRKLVPFLIEPTALEGLARQVVYKNVVGFDGFQLAAAVLEAIEPNRPKQSREAIRQKLAEVASPQARVSGGKIDAGPNVIFDKAHFDESLLDLPKTQQDIAETIRDSLPRNAPPVVGVCLGRYAAHLGKSGARPIVGSIDAWIAAIAVEFNAVGTSDDWGKGLGSLFESLFANHDRLRAHYSSAPPEFFAQTPIDEDKATGDALEDPIREVNDKAQEAVAAEVATPEFGNIVGGSAEFAREISMIASSRDDANPDSQRISVKRRYVLATIGFFITVYNLIGTTASIISTPQGLALWQALGRAIEKLMAFVL